MQSLAELSTVPIAANFTRFTFYTLPMVGLSGLEPPTSRLSGVRSNRLSYKPISRPSGSHRSALFCFARIAAHAVPALCGESPLSRLRSYHISQIQLLRSGYVVSSSGREPYLPGTVRRPMLCPRGLPAGGDKRDRTVDLLLAKQALSQLSYTPILRRSFSPSPSF